MVVFIKSEFEFTNVHYLTYMKLLTKYYSGIKVDVTIDNDIDKTITTNIDKDFIKSIDDYKKSFSGLTYKINTHDYCYELITIRTLPKYDEYMNKKMLSFKELLKKNITSSIDKVIEELLENEYAAKCALAKYISRANNFDDLKECLYNIKRDNEEKVTDVNISEDDEIVTIYINDEHAIFIGMDGVSQSNRLINERKKDIISITKGIDKVISSRLKLGEKESFIRSAFDKTYTLFELLSGLQNSTYKKNMTHAFVSANDEMIIIILNNSYPIMIGSTTVSDYTLPMFDIEEGYIGDNLYVPHEFNDQFNSWKLNLDTSRGDSWDTPILN